MAGPHPMTRTAAKRRITLAERDRFRQELIDIARRIFLDEGYGAVTIRRITSEAGVTPMAFYWYFDCKSALLTVIWDDILLESAEACQQAADAAGLAQDKVLAYFGRFVDFWLAHSDHFRFIFLTDAQAEDVASLRRQLVGMPGVQRHTQQYEHLLRQALAHQADAETRIQSLRPLSMYRAFGFLHCALGALACDAPHVAAQRALVIEEMARCLDHWATTSHP